MNNTRIIKKLFLYGVSACYAAVVISVVFLNRDLGTYDKVNLHLFSSYREAYLKMRIPLLDNMANNIVLRNILLNILLFVPLGFLLPFYSDKLKKLYRVVLIGFALTVVIEVLQYITKKGIVEADDIFNNTLGTALGYCLFMFGYNLIKKQNRKYTPVYILPFIAAAAVFLGMYAAYKNQEFGNLDFESYYRINMKDAVVENQIVLSEQRPNLDIYYKPLLIEKETREIAEEVFKKAGEEIDFDRTMLYENTAIYYTEHLHMWVDYNGGGYSYTDLSKPSAGTENAAKKSGAAREDIEKVLYEMGIAVPAAAAFEEIPENPKPYRFTVDMLITGDELVNGTLTCAYYEDGTIKEMRNNIIYYSRLKNIEVISEKEAYESMIKGNFRYDEYYSGRIKEFSVKGVEQRYALDTKGYFVPIYVFTVKINGNETTIMIPAVK